MFPQNAAFSSLSSESPRGIQLQLNDRLPSAHDGLTRGGVGGERRRRRGRGSWKGRSERGWRKSRRRSNRGVAGRRGGGAVGRGRMGRGGAPSVDPGLSACSPSSQGSAPAHGLPGQRPTGSPMVLDQSPWKFTHRVFPGRALGRDPRKETGEGRWAGTQPRQRL